MPVKYLLVFIGVFFPKVVFCQAILIDEYLKVFSAIKSDKELAERYCKGDSLNLAIFPQFHYFSLSKFDSYLNGEDIKAEVRKAKKIDAKQYKLQGELSYKSMTDSFYMALPFADSACAMICFDRLKGGFILAEITTVEPGLDWDRIVSQKQSYYLLFDVRGEKAIYKKLPFIR